MNLEKIVSGFKKGILGGALLYTVYSGAKTGVEAYMKGLDVPEVMAVQETRVERLSDGRIHIYERVERHKYLPPVGMVQQAPAPKERPKSLPEARRELDNPTREAYLPK